MPWYHYLAVFFSGAFLANAVPHFVQGISGNKFPTPFAKPPGSGLSSAPVNVLWGMLNIVIGGFLFTVSAIDRGHPASLVLFCIGAALMSVMMSVNFQKKDKE